MGCGKCGIRLQPNSPDWTNPYILSDEDKGKLLVDGKVEDDATRKLARELQSRDDSSGVFINRWLRGMTMDDLLKHEVVVKQHIEETDLVIYVNRVLPAPATETTEQ